MTGYVTVSVISGILFAVLDGLINANPIASKLFEVYKPIAKTSVNLVAGIIIDPALDSGAFWPIVGGNCSRLCDDCDAGEL